MEEKSEVSDRTRPRSLGEMLQPVWENRKKILMISAIVAAVTLGVNFLLPAYYKSTATLLPETEKGKLSALGQFADIASLAGVNIPGSEIARLYPSIVTSETVLHAVMSRKYKSESYSDSVDLVRFFDFDKGSPEKNIAASLEKLRGLLIPSFDNKTSVVSLSLEMREPGLAADVLNAIIEELDKFMRSKRITSASEQVSWIEARIGQVQQELRRDEEALRDFRERNRRIADSPQLLLVQQRLLRNVEVNSAVYVELKKQFELAKLEEIKNITIVNVLDKGRPPVKKASPKKGTNTAVAFLLVLVGLSCYFVLEPVYGPKVKEFLKRSNSIKPDRV